jgi:hypothetical protein
MGIIGQLLQDVPLPRMARIWQSFPAPQVDDLPGTLKEQFAKPGILDKVRPGMRIAIGVGSRGMAELPALVRLTVEAIRGRGAQPFIVPTMGSHGGATAEGQRGVLADLGVTEASAGCPIVSSMEVVEIGRLDNGLPVYIDQNAYAADGIVIVCRVKPHTSFRGPSESGLVKMIAIGLGKQRGAETCHAYSFKYMAEHILAMASVALARAPILFGIATVENPYDKIAQLAAVPARELMTTDRELLVAARANMPRFLFDAFDVLIVDRMGKEISGDGMDPNITGRYATPYASGGPEIGKLAVLDLTEQTHGNAVGIGAADFITRKLFDKIDLETTYANAFTSTVVSCVRIPVILANDRQAILAAIKTCNARDLAKARVVRIEDTLHLGGISISESMLAEARQHPQIEILSEPEEMRFDERGEVLVMRSLDGSPVQTRSELAAT